MSLKKPGHQIREHSVTPFSQIVTELTPNIPPRESEKSLHPLLLPVFCYLFLAGPPHILIALPWHCCFLCKMFIWGSPSIFTVVSLLHSSSLNAFDNTWTRGSQPWQLDGLWKCQKHFWLCFGSRCIYIITIMPSYLPKCTQILTKSEKFFILSWCAHVTNCFERCLTFFDNFNLSFRRKKEKWS